VKNAVSRNTSTRVVTINFTGDAPFIPATSLGNYNETAGGFVACGAGTTTTRPIPVTASLDGTLIGGTLSASLTFTGTPNGPISYQVEMTKASGL
jgi:hypothetical protein